MLTFIAGSGQAYDCLRMKGTQNVHSLSKVSMTKIGRWLPMLVLTPLLVSACSPEVKVTAPAEPITINLNVKLEADVRLRIEEQAEEDVETNPIF